MRVFIASLATETNTFAPMPTSLNDFSVVRDGNYTSEHIPPAVWARMAREKGWDVTESLTAFAEPSGITLRTTYELLRDEILDDLKNVMPVDCVLLDLHGAMVAEGYDDCEGDLIQRIRQIVGGNVAIGVELDLHCHITQTMIDNASVIITYKEYPHTDFEERAVEVFNVTTAAEQGKVQPHIALYDCRMVGIYHPTTDPVKSFVQRMKDLEGEDGVLSVSLGHGFPWGDVVDVGTRMLVVTDNQPEQGAQLAKELGTDFFAMRDQILPHHMTIDEALDTALAEADKPVVIADVSDNSGGGAPSDSTFMLKALLERGIEDVAIGCIWDPIVVAVVMAAGKGATLDLRIGGKMGPMSGDPVDVKAEVLQLAPDAIQHFGNEGSQMVVELGDSVAIRTQGIDIVMISKRTQTFTPEVFTNVGINPTQKKILIVKSMHHFYAGFAPIASRIIHCATPGAVAPDFANIPFKKALHDKWPLNANPFQ